MFECERREVNYNFETESPARPPRLSLYLALILVLAFLQSLAAAKGRLHGENMGAQTQHPKP